MNSRIGSDHRFAVPPVARRVLGAIGVLPFIIAVCFLFFGIWEERFVSGENLFNVVRQSTYLIIVSVGQMITLLTAGIDLSVGTNVAIVSVVTATVMAGIVQADPTAIGWAMTAGILAGLGTGAVVGMVNGIGVAILRVTPFVMTLGTFSMAMGLALFLTGGYGVYGMPTQFGDIFAYAAPLGIPVPILYAALVYLGVALLLNWTSAGRYFYAIGSNRTAARLSGINTAWYLFLAYAIGGVVTGIGGILLTARVETGQATLGGANLVLQSIAACVIAGVSLSGGKGLLRNVVLGAFFITLLSNGMNLLRIDNYLQTFILGAVLVIAIAIDQLRLRLTGQTRAD
ncbi:MAG: ABC transporter permease [Gammaproteobacteria bacterium]